MKRRGLVLLAPLLLSPLVLSLAACGKHDTATVANAAGATGSSTLAVGGQTTQPGQSGSGVTTSYTVAKGDSLWAISKHHCTTAPAIAKANGWSDGIDHPIFPGDVISVPEVECTTTTQGASPTTTQGDTQGDTPTTTPITASNGEIDDWLAQKDGFVPDPMYGDPADYYEDFGDVCMEAWGKTYEFEKLGLGRDDVLNALEPLPGRTPSKVLAAIDRWAAFTANWYLRYKTVLDKYTGADGTVNYDKIVANKDYRAFLAAYLPVAADQTAAHDYATKLCADLLSTKGSTP